MNEMDYSAMCCGEKMVPILRYLNDGVIYQTLQCNGCFRIIERLYVVEEKENGK